MREAREAVVVTASGAYFESEVPAGEAHLVVLSLGEYLRIKQDAEPSPSYKIEKT